ncbi:unnamed protein product [Cuscuta campestris]|uniref:Leucine-rich repeat-containing N-terminal plant-type domain-containing protein n=1 Tax=Cuscuta campestris TaxID=132261 RepID=A0A484L6T7_9ASTE|nr:unnamed protein product [Cuscuta campestris]
MAIFILSSMFLLFQLQLSESYEHTQGDALIALKNSLRDPMGALESWQPSNPNDPFSTPAYYPCGERDGISWFHITCDGDSVMRIDLGNYSLSGQLPGDLQYLPKLQYLSLYENNIRGEIPPELGELTNLISLQLSDNNLSGSIPSTLSKCTKLRFVMLQNNRLNGTIAPSLAMFNAVQRFVGQLSKSDG